MLEFSTFCAGLDSNLQFLAWSVDPSASCGAARRTSHAGHRLANPEKQRLRHIILSCLWRKPRLATVRAPPQSESEYFWKARNYAQTVTGPVCHPLPCDGRHRNSLARFGSRQSHLRCRSYLVSYFSAFVFVQRRLIDFFSTPCLLSVSAEAQLRTGVAAEGGSWFPSPKRSPRPSAPSQRQP